LPTIARFGQYVKNRIVEKFQSAAPSKLKVHASTNFD
jgi:hypothetical protein